MEGQDFSQYLNGNVLYGDDFDEQRIAEWYRAEEEGYFELLKDSKFSDDSYGYIYTELNELHGFRYLSHVPQFKHALGLGSAYGYEFEPIADRIQKLTIIEPSDNMSNHQIKELRPVYVKPEVDGELKFPDESFDLITTFGTLHHIPNVAFVLRELARVLTPGGHLLLREPIRNMGDWRQPRPGLTANERGIPYTYFEDFFRRHQLKVVNRSFCESIFFMKILQKFRAVDRTTRSYQRLDSLVSKLFSWNIHYNADSPLKKVSPGSVFYVVQKEV